MNQRELDRLRAWFENYVAGFYGDDESINADLKLKEDHTARTCTEMLYLADELGLSAADRRIAETIALFHDVGRFEQFTRYKTYNDAKSVPHALLGVQIIEREKTFATLDPDQRQLILKAIACHGQRLLPDDLADPCLTFAKMIRDADKLDIYYTITRGYIQYKDNPAGFSLALGLPDKPNCTPKVVEEVRNARSIDYSELRTFNDLKLIQLAWVHDINFPATLKRIQQRKFLETLADLLPSTPEIQQIKNNIFAHVQQRIAQANQPEA